MSKRIWRATRDGIPPIVTALERLAAWLPDNQPLSWLVLAEPERILSDVIAEQSAPSVSAGRFVGGDTRLDLLRQALQTAGLGDTAAEIDRRLRDIVKRLREWREASIVAAQFYGVTHWTAGELEDCRRRLDDIAGEADATAAYLKRICEQLKDRVRAAKPPRQPTPSQAVALDMLRDRPLPGDVLSRRVGVLPETVRRWCQKGGALYLHGVRNGPDGYFLPAD